MKYFGSLITAVTSASLSMFSLQRDEVLRALDAVKFVVQKTTRIDGNDVHKVAKHVNTYASKDRIVNPIPEGSESERGC